MDLDRAIKAVNYCISKETSKIRVEQEYVGMIHRAYPDIDMAQVSSVNDSEHRIRLHTEIKNGLLDALSILEGRKVGNDFLEGVQNGND